MKPHRLDRTMVWRSGMAALVAFGGVLVAPSSGEALGSTTAAAPATDVPTGRYILAAADEGDLPGLGRAAVELGGRVVARQNSLGTVVVDLPPATAGRLAALSGATVTADAPLTLQSTTGPTGVPGDMTNVARLTGATTFWRHGYVGQGVDVALLDSGVLPVNGLTARNKLVVGPDLSLESGEPTLQHMDTFGHGTHLAGIIAGRDDRLLKADAPFVGMAPGARVVSLKLADAQGRTDVSQVIAAIDWVVEHRNDRGLNIRVLNLSFGTDSSQDPRLDPLAHAAEVAWSKGVVVVVSAGNGDGTRSGLANPAYSPAVLAVGAVDPKGTLDRGDDVVPAFSRRGSVAEGKRAPDVVAPGQSVVSLRAPGSFLDERFGQDARVGTRFFKGSGTSQSAAVVSGAAALLLSQRPDLTPDQVKDLLRRSADSVPGASTDAQGAGSLDLAETFAESARAVAAAKVHAGGGSLERSRGRFHLRNAVGQILSGERDVLGRSVDTDQLAAAQSAGATWAGGSYNGATWAGGGWGGDPSLGATWNGATWAGATWAGATWAGATWAGATWAGATWAGATWAGTEWANDLWSSAGWS